MQEDHKKEKYFNKLINDEKACNLDSLEGDMTNSLRENRPSKKIYAVVIALVLIIVVLLVALIMVFLSGNLQSSVPAAGQSQNESTTGVVGSLDNFSNSRQSTSNIKRLSWHSEDDPIYLPISGYEQSATAILMVETTDGETFDINDLKFYSDDPAYVSVEPDFYGDDFVVCKITSNYPWGEDGKDVFLFASTSDDHIRVINSLNLNLRYSLVNKPYTLYDSLQEYREKQGL